MPSVIDTVRLAIYFAAAIYLLIEAPGWAVAAFVIWSMEKWVEEQNDE